MDNQTAKELIDKYKSGEETAEELAMIEKWILMGNVRDMDLSESEFETELNMIRSGLPLRYMPKERKLWQRIAVVAAAVAAIAFGIWFFSAPRHLDDRRDLLNYTKNDIAPGKNTATLTVNGKQTQLSEKQTGVVVGDDIKYTDGTRVISGADPSSRTAGRDLLNGTDKRSLATLDMTVQTPRGGTYSIILQDGTKVWLNADSKLELLPNFWNKAQRIVKLTGEAYFEVAKSKQRPFTVRSAGQDVTVLGTHFNISAYAGEGIRTTLLEGSVSVGGVNNGEAVFLKPNQQSLVTANQPITVKEVNTAEAVAWKDGYFRFYEVDLETFMTTIARWYAIEVVYEGGIGQYKDLAFGGSVSRSKNISEVLKILAQTGKVHYKIEGKKVTITK